jgi:hypothetical protein
MLAANGPFTSCSVILYSTITGRGCVPDQLVPGFLVELAGRNFLSTNVSKGHHR